jgi:hypothetical protein
VAQLATDITGIGVLEAGKRRGISFAFLKDHVQEDTSGAKRVSAAVHRTGMVFMRRSFGIEKSTK